jgi:hypothetical protein
MVSIVRKILITLLVVVVLFLLLLIVGGLTYKPFFEVRNVEIVDHDGYPCVRVSFKTSYYPIEFYLFTDKGEKIDNISIKKAEETIYLRLPSLYKNVIGPKSYVIKAFHDNKELWSEEVKIKGASADVKIVGINASVSGFYLCIKNIDLEVRNTGDVPLYLYEEDRLYLDGMPETFYIEPHVIVPGESSKIRLSPHKMCIYYDKLDRNHEIWFSIPSVAEGSHIIRAPEPILKIDEVRIRSSALERYVYSITLTISNIEEYPVDIAWLDIYVNERSVYYQQPSYGIINPGENKTIVIDFSPMSVPEQFTVRVKLGRTEVSYSSSG